MGQPKRHETRDDCNLEVGGWNRSSHIMRWLGEAGTALAAAAPPPYAVIKLKCIDMTTS